jgi:C-terminal peptidase prc
MIRTHALWLGLLLSIAPLATATSQEGQDLSKTLAERTSAAVDQSVEEIFEEAQALSEAAKSSGAAGLDKALDDAVNHSATLNPKAQLFVLSARLRIGEGDRSAAAARLCELLATPDEEVARAAAALLSDKRFNQLAEKDQKTVVEKLTSAMQDSGRSPAYRLECATALHAQGRGEGQRAARKEMMEFLTSSDPKLRGLGALALAHVGDIETGRRELERLALLPGDEGRLAESYLHQDDIRSLYDRREKNLIKHDQDEMADGKIKPKADLVLIEKVIQMIQKFSLEADQPQAKRENLIDSALDGMLRSLDEHSSYMTSKQYKLFDQDLLQAEYGGIGAYVNEDPDDRLFTITKPIYSGPAYKAGLHSDDKIVRIDEWPTFTPSGSQPTDEIIKRLKGKPETKVKLYIWRRGMDPALIDRPTEDMAVTVTRKEIQIPPVAGEMLPGQIGLVELTTFSRVASEALTAKLNELKAQGMKGVILDLRNDTGGLLTEARNVANLFLPKGKLVVKTESRIDDPERLSTLEDPLIPADMPVAVLINRFSASASEIVSGALQDYSRATLVGQRSFGKGSVQQLLMIPGEHDDEYVDENHNNRHDSWEPLTKDWNGNGEFDFAPRVRMTIARYLLPTGRSIHREIDDKGNVISEGGVEPDVPVAPRRYEAWKAEEMFRLTRKEHKIRDWVDKTYDKSNPLFRKLADGDDDDTSLYPGFDELYNSLDTMLTPQDVRMLVRTEIRRRVQDDRGEAFPDGDYEEDPQLQEGIRIVLEQLKLSPNDIESYAKTFKPIDKKDTHSGRMLTANMSDTARNDLRHALALIGEAKSGGRLSPEHLSELEKVLQSVLDK